MDEEYKLWLEKHGVAFKNVEVRKCTQGLGIFSTVEHCSHEELLSIPLHTCLSLKASAESEEYRLFKKEFGQEQINDRALLYCFMISQKFRDDSFFGPYLRSLPTTYTDPLWWDEKEIAYLDETNLGESTLSLRESLLEEYNMVFPRVKNVLSHFFPLEVSFESYLWAHSSFVSRQYFDASGINQSSLGECIIPIFDTLNHDPQTSVEWKISDTHLILTVQENCSIYPDEQIYITYPTRSNGDMLETYGFCQVDNFSKDSVLAFVTLSDEDPMYAQKLAVQNRFGIASEFHLQDHNISKDIQCALRIGLMDEVELESSNSLNSLDFISVENEFNMIDTLQNLILSKYDRMESTEIMENSETSKNMENASIYRAGQRHILEAYLDLIPHYEESIIEAHPEAFDAYQQELENE